MLSVTVRWEGVCEDLRHGHVRGQAACSAPDGRVGGRASPCYELFPLAATLQSTAAGEGTAPNDRVTRLGTNFDPQRYQRRRCPACRLMRMRALTRTGGTAMTTTCSGMTSGPVARYACVACLCREGCAYRDWLIVSGLLRGQVWDTSAGASTSHLASPRTAGC